MAIECCKSCESLIDLDRTGCSLINDKIFYICPQLPDETHVFHE